MYKWIPRFLNQASKPKLEQLFWFFVPVLSFHHLSLVKNELIYSLCLSIGVTQTWCYPLCSHIKTDLIETESDNISTQNTYKLVSSFSPKEIHSFESSEEMYWITWAFWHIKHSVLCLHFSVLAMQKWEAMG